MKARFFLASLAAGFALAACGDTFTCGVKAVNDVAAAKGVAAGEYKKLVESLKDDDFETDAERDAARAKVYAALLAGEASPALRDYLYQIAAGIQPGYKGGWDDFELAPEPDKRLGHVEATKDVKQGTIKSAWKFVDGKCRWSFTIPAGTKATVCVNGMCTRYDAGDYTLEIKEQVR